MNKAIALILGAALAACCGKKDAAQATSEPRVAQSAVDLDGLIKKDGGFADPVLGGEKETF